MTCDIGGGVTDEDLEVIEKLSFDFARVGFTAVAVRPAHADIAVDGSRLASFIERVHRTGVKVIVRLSGARVPGSSEGAFVNFEQDVSSLVVRTRAALKAGADGIDLGIIREDDQSGDDQAQRFTQLIHILQAELADFDRMPILAAESSITTPHALSRHLEEDWFHHLRDDALVTCPWDINQLRARIERTLSKRSNLGHVSAWQWSHCPTDNRPVSPVPASWEEGASQWRRNAMALVALSLPGAAYTPFDRLAGRRNFEASGGPHVEWESSDNARLERDMLTRALRIRVERSMGSGSLAYVDNLGWVDDGVGVHLCAGVMVVTNTSDSPVEVPAEHVLLLDSTGRVSDEPNQPTVVGPDQCAWFEAALVQAPPVSSYS